MIQRSRSFLAQFGIAAGLVLLAGCSPADRTESPAQPTLEQAKYPKFDGNRAFDLLKKQVDIGHRVPNTPAHAECADFIVSALEPYAGEVTTQPFAVVVGDKQLRLKNIIARFDGRGDRWVLLAAHWDTRPTADCEVLAEKRKLPIPGANDGASGVAVLLELARLFHRQKPNVGVAMVFFDGEDYGPGEPGMFLGSKHFASQLKKGLFVPELGSIAYGVLLDMVGDKNLRIPQEINSLQAAPDVVKRIWQKAFALGYEKSFPSVSGMAISDDHLPLIKAGMKCVDLIDFDYGPWHTLDDTPDKCSPQSLKTVGDVVAALVYEEKAE